MLKFIKRLFKKEETREVRITLCIFSIQSKGETHFCVVQVPFRKDLDFIKDDPYTGQFMFLSEKGDLVCKQDDIFVLHNEEEAEKFIERIFPQRYPNEERKETGWHGIWEEITVHYIYKPNIKYVKFDHDKTTDYDIMSLRETGGDILFEIEKDPCAGKSGLLDFKGRIVESMNKPISNLWKSKYWGFDNIDRPFEEYSLSANVDYLIKRYRKNRNKENSQ